MEKEKQQYINLIPLLKETIPPDVYVLRKPLEPLFKVPIRNKMVFIASRSVGKSYTMGTITLLLAKYQKGMRIGYVMPTREQIQLNSQETFNTIINNSPKLLNMYAKISDQRGVYQKKFKNGSVITFRWQMSSREEELARKQRGAHPDVLVFDEVQDLSWDFIDKVTPSIIPSKFAIQLYAGTFKTEFHPSYELYMDGTQTEWIVVCPNCNRENRATRKNIDYNRLDIGPFCEFCQYPLSREIIRKNGKLVSFNPNAEYFSLRMSALFAYWVPWRQIMQLKSHHYENFVNEVIGEPTSLQDKILTDEDIKNACSNYPMVDYVNPDEKYLLFAGIDWQGDYTYTVLTILGYKNGKLYVLYVKKYTGEESKKDSVHLYVERDLNKFRPLRIFGDWGMGLGRNTYLASKGFPIFEFEFTGGDNYPKYDEKRGVFVGSKFRLLETVFSEIKNKKIVFPSYNYIRPFVREYTSYIRVEYARRKEPYLTYDKEDPQALDDALMSLLLAYASYHTFTKNIGIITPTIMQTSSTSIESEINYIKYLIEPSI